MENSTNISLTFNNSGEQAIQADPEGILPDIDTDVVQVLRILYTIIAVLGFSLNTAQIFWILSHNRKTVMDAFIVSLSVSCLFSLDK